MTNSFWTDVDANKKIVLVFLHIQKSAGTFIETQFTRSGVRGFQCNCRPKVKVCDCKKDNRIWLFCRYSVGWRCGLHADFTELSACVPTIVNKLEKKKRPRIYAYFTILRDPINRYLSEWQHARRGATWRSSTLRCNDKSPSETEYRPCYLHELENFNNFSVNSLWMNVSLEEFASCRYNLANNRQTRMLASLDTLDCYAKLSQWTAPGSDIPSVSSQRKLLRSAITNLATRFVVFGLAEHLMYTQYMYQSVFGIVFKTVFVQPNFYYHQTHAELSQRSLQGGWEEIVSSHNLLDVDLLKFAKKLFSARLAALILSDSRLPISLRRSLKSAAIRSIHGGRDLLFDCHFQNRTNKFLFRLFRSQKSKQISPLLTVARERYWNLKLTRDWKLARMSETS